jgi:hypothetical protein
MSDGATMSAPARAWETAARASKSSVGSFRISWPSTIPQCPWSVYSHKQTSLTITIPGTALRIAVMARCTAPSGAYASEPVASFFSGSPNNMIAGIPSPATSRHSSTA